jgi:hypothetical protein
LALDSFEPTDRLSTKYDQASGARTAQSQKMP